MADVLRSTLLLVAAAWVWFLISLAYKSARQELEPNWIGWLRKIAHDHRAKKIGERIGSVALCIVVLAIVGSAKDEWTRIPAGSKCLVSRNIYGVSDLDQAYSELDKARRVNDEFGIAELAQQDVAILLPAGTHGLVIDTDFFKHFTFYRKVRILSEPYVGKALWIRRDALTAAPASHPPAPHNPYR